MKVYLQYPLFKSDSQYYRSIINFPPKEISYETSHKNPGMILNKNKFNKFKILKKIIRTFFNISKFPLPSAFYVKNSDKYDLIHCAHCLCLNKKPWVADIEFISQMWGVVKLTPLRKFFVKKLILSKNCKKIMPWTEKTKEDILKEFPEIRNKIEVLPYGLELPNKKHKTSKGITLLFAARYFYGKGGLHALEAMDRLTKKYKNVNAIFISEVPEKISRKYSKNKKIKISGLVPFEKIINEVYPKSDIYVYPGYADSFGFTFLEAQSFGIPIITVDGYARREVVENGKTGFIIPRKKELDYNQIDEEIIKKLIENTSRLIEDKKLLKKMSKNCIEEIKNGKFSIRERNKKLKRIYREALG